MSKKTITVCDECGADIDTITGDGVRITKGAPGVSIDVHWQHLGEATLAALSKEEKAFNVAVADVDRAERASQMMPPPPPPRGR